MREFHEYAQLFPLNAEGEGFDKFCDDVKANGVRFPIILHRDGSVLDGCRRTLACELADIDPYEIPFEQSVADVEAGRTYDESALEFVMSANSHRRHLTDDQRAVIAVEYKKHFAVEAAKRQKAGKADNTKIKAADRRSDQRAAKAAGVGRSKVNAAEKVMKTATPKDIDDVRKGKKTLKQLIKKTTPKKAKPVPVDTVAILEKDAKVFVAAMKLATKTADTITPAETRAIATSLGKVEDGITLLKRALLNVETAPKLIKKGDIKKAGLIANAFATELGR